MKSHSEVITANKHGPGIPGIPCYNARYPKNPKAWRSLIILGFPAISDLISISWPFQQITQQLMLLMFQISQNLSQPWPSWCLDEGSWQVTITQLRADYPVFLSAHKNITSFLSPRQLDHLDLATCRALRIYFTVLIYKPESGNSQNHLQRKCLEHVNTRYPINILWYLSHHLSLPCPNPLITLSLSDSLSPSVSPVLPGDHLLFTSHPHPAS